MPCGDRVQILLGEQQTAEIHLWLSSQTSRSLLLRESLESIKNQCLLEDNPQKTAIVLLESETASEEAKKTAEEYANFVVDVSGLDELSARMYGIISSKADFVVSFSLTAIYPRGVMARLIKPMLDNPEISVTTGSLIFARQLLSDPIDNLCSTVADSLFRRYKPEITAVRRADYANEDFNLDYFVATLSPNRFLFVPKATARVVC